MKLQWEGQQWRVRIDEDELASLLAGDTLHSVSRAADCFDLRYAVRLVAQAAPSLAGDASQWELRLPEAPVRELAARLPSRDGLHFMLPSATAAHALELRFDVDVRDSARRLKASRKDA